MLRDTTRDGELVAAADEGGDASNDDLGEDTLDNEVDLGDEDALQTEEVDPRDDGFGDEFRLGRDGDDLSSDDPFAVSGGSFRLLVHDGRCRLEIPSWFAGIPPQESANHPLTEPFQLLETLHRIAQWLNEYRIEFLRDPDPWHLGIDALEELKKGAPSVTEDGLLQLLGLKADINRHKRHCELVWEDGAALPLDFLFRTESKQAWVASALVLRYRGEPLSSGDLDLLNGLTIPKDGKNRKEILSGGVDGLDFHTFVQRACILAGTSWSGLSQNFLERILCHQPSSETQ